MTLTWSRQTVSRRTVAEIRERLLQTFDDYHSSIRLQTALVDELVEAVRREEREGIGGATDVAATPPEQR
jgi:hypothetical protein